MYECLVASPFRGAEEMDIITNIHPNNMFKQVLKGWCAGHMQKCMYILYVNFYICTQLTDDLYK